MPRPSVPCPPEAYRTFAWTGLQPGHMSPRSAPTAGAVVPASVKDRAMTIRSTDLPRSASERRAESKLPVFRELAETPVRDKKLKDGIHPCLRALPDYP